MYCRHAHNVRGTLSQLAAWLESGCLRSDGYETLEVKTARRREPYLDLKRIKNRRARLAMRCGLLRNL